MRQDDRLRRLFIVLWAVLLVLKGWIAWRLPTFVDEAFYAWEGRHLAWAYSDLPGLTAWLTRLGVEIGGQNPFAMRLPFLAIGAALPWLIVGLARRWFGAGHAWLAGLLALLMPLSGTLGFLALPDVPMVFAALLCLEGLARLRERVGAAGLAILGLGLVMGALTHYRFALVLAAGLAGMLFDARGRALLREPRLWGVVLIGALAWLPLLLWNLDHASAGLRFQFVDRHPWAFHADAAIWLPRQFLLVTPALFVLLAWTGIAAWRRRSGGDGPWGLIAGFAGVGVLGYFALGFFVDSERVSFHWPLTGWLLLVVAAPGVLMTWRAAARKAVWGLAALGLATVFGYFISASQPGLRTLLAGTYAYPGYFAGWREISAELRRLAPPPDTRIVADYVDLASQLAFNLDKPDIYALDHATNHRSGRAEQLRVWGRQYEDLGARGNAPVLLVVENEATNLELRLERYHRLCRLFGSLPKPMVLSVDHGHKYFQIFRIAGPAAPGCVAPALVYADRPRRGDKLPAVFEVSGWAFKEGVGLDRVEVTLDGKVVARAEYGLPMPHVTAYWKISTDPNHPNVGFRARVDASALAPGGHWLGFLLRGADGSVESNEEIRVSIGR